MEGGSKCSKMCWGDVVEVQFCEHGDWTVDLAGVECFAEVGRDSSWTWVVLIVFILCKIW